MYALLAVGVVAFFIARAVAVSSITAKEWPFCDQCVKQRTAKLAVLWAGVGAAAISFVIVVLIEVPGVFLAGLLVLAVALVAFLVTGSWPAISGARLGDHPGWVEVHNAHPAFQAEFGRVAVPEGPQAVAPPPQVVRKLNSLWYVGLVGGILLAIAGAVALLRGPTCGSEQMRPGDVCETIRRGATSISTYEEELATGRVVGVGGGAGLVLAVLSGLRIRRWNAELRRAYAAAHQATGAA